ncbi:hypothetical protein BHE74_00059458 [Ensete ventricosum]|nr:hypothetical protein BHE74_00059458 [Ensete ventricosum]
MVRKAPRHHAPTVSSSLSIEGHTDQGQRSIEAQSNQATRRKRDRRRVSHRSESVWGKRRREREKKIRVRAPPTKTNRSKIGDAEALFIEGGQSRVGFGFAVLCPAGLIRIAVALATIGHIGWVQHGFAFRSFSARGGPGPVSTTWNDQPTP